MSNWIPTAERLPDMGQNVLLYFSERMSTWLACRSYHRDSTYPIVWKTQDGSVLVRGWKEDEEPSHWMPLPEPPK